MRNPELRVLEVGEAIRVDVATGGEPEDALVEAMVELIDENGVYQTSVAHDDTCPCLLGEPPARCTCEIVAMLVLRTE